MGKKLILTILATTTIVITILLIFNTFTCKQREQIAILEKKVKFLKTENIPIRFKILDKEDGKIRVAIKFYDADGNDIERIEKTLEGDELSFDFLVFPVKNKYIAFPYKIYTDKIAPVEGENLTKYYDEKNFPKIFYFKGIDNELMTGLSLVFEKIKTNDISSDDKYFGNMVHDISKLKSYKINTIYKIITHIKGGIEVVEE